jgi:transcriptional regulator with XRE-family HTH domain
LVELKQGLRELKERDGDPSYREIAKRTSYSHTVLAMAVNSPALPTWQVTSALVAACGGEPDEWRARWESASEAVGTKHEKAASADNLAGQTAAGDSRIQFATDLARRLDKAHGSRRAIAGKAGYSPSTLSAVLSGSRLPRPEMLSAVLGAVDASPDEIDQWLERRIRLGTAEHTGRLLQAFAETQSGWRRVTRHLRLIAAAGVLALLAAVGTVYLLLHPRVQPPQTLAPESADPSPNATPSWSRGRDRLERVAAPVRAYASAAKVDPADTSPPLLPGTPVKIICRILSGQPMPAPDDDRKLSTVWALTTDGRRLPYLYLTPDGGAAAPPDCDPRVETLVWPDSTRTRPDQPAPPQYRLAIERALDNLRATIDRLRAAEASGAIEQTRRLLATITNGLDGVLGSVDGAGPTSPTGHVITAPPSPGKKDQPQ